MLTLTELAASYPEQTQCFSLTAAPGTITALIGPSGAGKSTLLAMIGGFARIDSGTLSFNGNSLLSLAPAERPMTTLFQDNNLFWHMSVQQNIAIGLNAGLKLTQSQQQQVRDVAEQVGIGELLKRKPAQLSGGQQQRVGLARCLARNRPILLLDEPFSALDPALRYELLQLLRKQTDRLQLTVLMVTHHPTEAAGVADQIAFIHDGHILEQGDNSVLATPRTTELRVYLGAAAVKSEG